MKWIQAQVTFNRLNTRNSGKDVLLIRFALLAHPGSEYAIAVADPVPFLSFYNRLGFAPTRQQTSSSNSLSARRAFLYRTLGIPNLAVRGSDIIEFGPGVVRTQTFLFLWRREVISS